MKHRVLILLLLSFILFSEAFCQEKRDKHVNFKTSKSTANHLQSVPLTFSDSDYSLLSSVGLKKSQIQNFTLQDYEKTAHKVLQYLENHGYPFAEISILPDTSSSEPNYRVAIDKKRFIKIDSIILKGNLKLNTGFLWPYLGLRRHAAYKEKNIIGIDSKLSELAFASVIQPSGLSFEENKTLLYIYLDKRNTNKFDGYIGFQPVSTANNRLSVTGELSLELQNIMRQGERIAVSWHSSERYSQFLDVKIAFPYLFRTHFGVDANFNLDKQDTSFLNLSYNIGIPYHINTICFVRPFFNLAQSRILGNADSDISILGHRKTLYGLTVKASMVDYVYNPRRGFETILNFAAGRRVIQRNTLADDYHYDDVELQKNSFQINGEIVGYIPLFKRFTVVLRTQAGTMFSGNNLYNELFKIGGEGKIRGFTYNEIAASTFLLYSAEFRYLFGKNSDVHVFFDGATYESAMTNRYVFDSPFGFGIGVNVGVRSGIFYFEYALPKQFNNHISFKTGKIHIGVKALF